MITALIWCERILAFAVFFQSIELLQLKKIWQDTGVWRWHEVRNDYLTLPPSPLSILDYFLTPAHFEILLKVRMVCAVLIWIIHPVLFVGILFLSTWLISIRFRGLFNGGSDSMTALIALALTVAQGLHHHELAVKACLAYIAIQLVLSYFLAGLAKIKNPDWRAGLAFAEFFKTPRYDSPPAWIKSLMSKAVPARRISWAILIFECSFPLALVSTKLCAVYLATAFAFHILNFYVFGLNRFVWAWAAAYPALYFWSQRS